MAADNIFWQQGWFADHAPRSGALIIASTGGSGSTADTTLQIWGLWHLAGASVGVTVGGIFKGNYTVATDGSVTLSYDGTFSPAYLNTLTGILAGNASDESMATFNVYVGTGGTKTVTVPVIIGYTFTAQGQTLRPATAADVRSQAGDALGLTRRGHMFSALLVNVPPNAVNFGTDFSATLQPVDLRNGDGSALPATSAFSGVYWNTLEDNYGFDTMLAWESTVPLPCTVCAVSLFLNAGER